MTSSPPGVRWNASESCSTRTTPAPCWLRDRAEGKEREVDDTRLKAGFLEQLRGALLADDRKLHDERPPLVREQAGKERDEVVEETAPPVVEGR